MICPNCNNPGVLNTVMNKDFYYCRTCKDEIKLEQAAKPVAYVGHHWDIAADSCRACFRTLEQIIVPNDVYCTKETCGIASCWCSLDASFKKHMQDLIDQINKDLMKGIP